MVPNDGAQGSLNGTRPHPPISPRTFFWVSTPAPHLSSSPASVHAISYSHGAEDCVAVVALGSVQCFLHCILRSNFLRVCVRVFVRERKRERMRERERLAWQQWRWGQRSVFYTGLCVLISCVCVCVCECVYERESERERGLRGSSGNEV